ncbi:MAG TPA: hypothetical protein VMH86_02380 [Rhizomicrobium sp.]|nr:hypothetical protein [Rhizomicrobium sp.]
MSNPRYFRSRAAEYRRLALDCADEQQAGNLFEIAGMFDSMAADMTSRPKAVAWPEPGASRVSALLTRASSVFLSVKPLSGAARILTING